MTGNAVEILVWSSAAIVNMNASIKKEMSSERGMCAVGEVKVALVEFVRRRVKPATMLAPCSV